MLPAIAIEIEPVWIYGIPVPVVGFHYGPYSQRFWFWLKAGGEWRTIGASKRKWGVREGAEHLNTPEVMHGRALVVSGTVF